MPRHKPPNSWFQQAIKVSEDPAASNWLKAALIEAINRDPVDSATDAELLAKILRLRVEVIKERHSLSNADK